MTLTIQLKPELERRLRETAAKEGLGEEVVVVRALEQVLGSESDSSTCISDREVELLQGLHLGIPEPTWARYSELVGKADAETLTPDEQQEFVRLAHKVEEANARRMANAAALAQLRGVALPTLLEQLGIRPIQHG